MADEYYSGSIEETHEEAIADATDGKTFDAWIDGEARGAVSGDTFTTYDPVVDEPIAEVPRCRGDDVDAAVAAAREAYRGEWGDTTPKERAGMVTEWGDRIRDHIDELALLDSLDVGKPLANVAWEIDISLDFFDYYASVVQADEGQQIPAGDDMHAYVKHEPYGVVGAVLPWNYPFQMVSWKLPPALVSGNTVVFKPSEQSPLSASLVAELAAEVFPDGVVNLVHGYGDEAGAALTEHRDVDKVSFTGSVETGRAVMKAATNGLKPVTLELGGKNPFVVFPDADVEQAVEDAAMGRFYNTGQSCDSCSRMIVHEDVHDEFVEQFVERAESYVLGDTLNEDTTMGPLAFEQQYEKVAQYVDVAREEGATLLTGGEPPADPDLADGWFFRPTVFDDVEPDMRIAQEETFGPVASVLTFSTYEEAIELANDTKYGLASGVATGDPSTAHRAANDIEAGSVWVNQYFGSVPGTPFGGFKQSGIGRECARETLREYTQSKSVSVALDAPEY